MRRGRLVAVAAVLAYAALLAASWAVRGSRGDAGVEPPPTGVSRAIDTRGGAERRVTGVAAATDGGPVGGRAIAVASLTWPSGGAGTPVVLLHGSPGSASNFGGLGPAFASMGRPAHALDMPGFGGSTAWVPSYSARAYARVLLAWMDANGVERAHVVGWSNGGNVALHAADLAAAAGEPGRLASITLLAGTGVQETEGSGSRVFELGKYLLGYAALVVGPELVPHFGLFDPVAPRHAFLRNFIDTDQRLARPIMAELRTPTLIVQGRGDFLVPPWAAEVHHGLIGPSTLVMLPGSHFLPFTRPALVAGEIEPFLERHDAPGVEPVRERIDREPPPPRGRWGGLIEAARGAHWTAWLAGLALLARWRPELTTAAAAVFVCETSLDIGVASLGVFLGRALSRREPWGPPRTPLRLLGAFVWSVVAVGLAWAATRAVSDEGRLSAWSAAVAVPAVAAGLGLLKFLPTRERRRRLDSGVRRALHHEWWPVWALYLPLLPRFVALAIEHRGALVWTAANPGVGRGGGVVDEPKSAILDGLAAGDAPGDALARGLLPHAVVEPAASFGDGGERARLAAELVETRPELGGYPIVLKPDTGERGAGVRLVRTAAALADALADTPGRAVLQRYHPGPEECGVFWVRRVETVGGEREPAPGEPAGLVFSITRKTFQRVTGDGARTLRELVMADRRARLQRRVFFRRHLARLDTVVPAGETVRLGEAGNHAQGCVFSDGADLITPGLAAAVDRVAGSFRGVGGGPFDFGRFDLRYESDDALRRGEGFGVVELNGVTSESTNLYDPSRGPRSAWRLLAAQWALLYELGAARRAAGERPMPLGALLRLVLAPRDRSAEAD